MKNIWILFSIIPLNILSQNITGTVKDSITKENVEFATVYINGTTIGTMSDKDGYFSFQLKQNIVPCQLVISHVSYRSKVVTIDENSGLNLTIPVTPKVMELGQVDIVDKDLREKNIRHFKDVFLGTDIWGKNAILENDGVLIFDIKYHDKKIDDHSLIGKPEIFKVESTAPLKINLPLLGYDLQLDLISFIEKQNPDSKTTSISILGYYFFKPKETGSKSKKNKYIRNRLHAYFYSPQHFTRSLYENKLPENGYNIYELPYSAKNKEFVVNSCIPDSCVVFNSDSAVISGLKNHIFRVDYYSDNHGFPVNSSESEFYATERSSISFLYDKCVIRKDGTRPGESIVFGPGIGNKRVGATLPNDYNPEIK